MKTSIGFILLLIFSLSSFAKSIDRSVDLILSSQKDQNLTLDRAWIKRQIGVWSVTPLFTTGEQRFLNSINANYLGNTIKIKMRTLKSAQRLRDKIAHKYPSLDIESRQMDILPQTQNDPLISRQWALKNVGKSQSLDLDQMIIYKAAGRAGEDIRMSKLAGQKEVIVAVLDTGVDKAHPDLLSNIVTKKSECVALEKFLQCVKDSDRKTCEAKWFDLNNPEVDQDKNGYPLDCQGWSTMGGVNAAKIMGRPDFADDLGHGTHVSGIIGAVTGNKIGVSALSNKIKILPVQVLGDNPSEPIKPQSTNPANEEENQYSKRNLGDLVARGVIYAMASNAQVINFSLGWPQSQDSALMRKMIEEAQAQGIIVVAAAGNDSTSALLRPCGYKNVICVGAQGPDGAASHFSNFGTGVDLLAPGTNILSTYPVSKRSIRFKEQNGYDFLSGTSQATPYVSAAAAYLLSLGIPLEEVYPRLVLGSRSLLKPLKVLVSKNQVLQEQDLSKTYEKHFLAGNLDIQSAVDQVPQSLIVPSSKERNEVKWNLENQITFKFSLINKWEHLKKNNFKILSVAFQKQKADMERPKITSINYDPFQIWAQGEEREFTVVAQIENSTDISRIPSDLNLIVNIEFDGVEKKYLLEYDLVRQVGLTNPILKSKLFEIQNMPKEWFSIIPFDAVYDGNRQKVDYLGINYEEGFVNMYLISQGSTQDYTVPYNASKVVTIEGLENLENVTEQYLMRLDLDGDKVSEYIVGLLTDNSSMGEKSPVNFYVFNSEFKLIESFVYDSAMSQMPREIFGMKIGKSVVPTWIGLGMDPEKEPSLIDSWINADVPERPEYRIYYLDKQRKIHSIKAPEDMLLVTLVQAEGALQLILSKSVNGSNYLNEYYVGQVVNGVIKDMKPIKISGNYHNISDSREDKLWSLKSGDKNFLGQFWFSQAGYKQIGLSVYDAQSKLMRQFDLKALREHTDAPLWIRSATLGEKTVNAFVFTNSELQFHDLNLDQVASRSLERFTFYVGSAFTNFHFPSVIRDQRNNQKIPVLYTPEITELSRGIKFIAPNYNAQGNLIELISPARLRMQSEQGCRSVDVPVVHTEATELDYICKDKIIRIPLEF